MGELVEFWMHRDGVLIGLDRLISRVPENDWVWSVLEFDGIGHGPAGLGYAEFREVVSSSRQGYVMSWAQVQEYADEVAQCFDLLLVAVKDVDLLDSARFAAGDFEGCLLVITASDSTWWSVEVDTEIKELSALVADLRSRYGDG
ncbi:hypothetical protein [Streptomyces fradiae]|uniref:hypothetical protein n=1 Tax=Streptomyces fradiae TaxID=1906 RepID=UPI003656C731